MLSVYLCSVAVLICIVLGGLLGVWAASSNTVSGAIRPTKRRVSSWTNSSWMDSWRMRREVAVQLLLNERRWLPDVARWLHLSVPKTVVAVEELGHHALPGPVAESVRRRIAMRSVSLDSAAQLALDSDRALMSTAAAR